MPARQASSQEQIVTLLKQLDREISAQELYIELRHQNQSLGLQHFLG
jgi:Fur family ferric uptake transcriptional regulator